MKKLLCLSNANNATLLKIPKQAGIITSILLAFSPVMSANGNPVAEPEIVVQVSQQSSTVKGVVEDDMGPVVGATVVVKGTTNGTVTDMDGNFSLPGVKEGSILVVCRLSLSGNYLHRAILSPDSAEGRLETAG